MFKLQITFILILFTASFAFSQQYVDIATAKNKISELEKQNSDLKAKAETLRKEISDLQEKNKANEKKIEDIRIVHSKVGVKSSALYYYSKDISDEATKKAALDAYNKNNDVKVKLEDKSYVLKYEIKENNKKIGKKDTELSDCLYKIDANIMEIRKYEASVNKTASQNDLVNSYIKSVDQSLTEADTVLK